MTDRDQHRPDDACVVAAVVKAAALAARISEARVSAVFPLPPARTER